MKAVAKLDSSPSWRDFSRVLFAETGPGVLLVGPDCLVADANRSAERLTGYSRAELVGLKACSDLFVSEGTTPCICPGVCPVANRYGTMEALHLEQRTLRHRGAKRIPVMVSVAPMARGDRRLGYALVLWDVADRLQLEFEDARRRRQAQALGRIGREIAAYANLSANLDRILDEARDLFQMDVVAWGLLDQSAACVTWSAARGPASHRLRGANLRLPQGVMGRILMAGRPYVTRNLSEENQADELFQNPALRTAVAVPFPIRDTSSGVLLCATTAESSLTDEDVLLISHLGSYLATAEENAALLGEVKYMATLEERQRLAREMHDSLGQTLSYFGVRLHMIAKAAARGDAAFIARETADLKQVLAEAHGELRGSIFQLKESGTPRAPLYERWVQILTDFSERTGVKTTVELDGRAMALLPEAIQAQLTRILQEALTNVRNHSGAFSVAVQFGERAGGTLSLTIADDGCGFEVAGVDGPEQRHFGLSIMHERAAAIGAELELRSMRGQGTTVSVRLPATGRRAQHGEATDPHSAG